MVEKWIGFVSNTPGAAAKREYRAAVLLAAVACAAVIGRAYLPPSGSPAPTAEVVAAKAADKLPAWGVTVEAVSSPAAAAVEFAAVYGLSHERPYTTPAAIEWSAPTQAARQEHEPAVAKRKATLMAQICAGDCRPPSVSTAVTIIPPPRPADLTLTAAASAQDDKRVRLLGLALPGFVPSGERIAKTVVSWGGSIAGVIPGL